jgi:hypothetical protein
MKKQTYAFFVLFFMGNILFGTSRSNEEFRIENHTAKELFIRLEFNERIVDAIDWYQNIDGILLAITNEYQLRRASMVPSGQSKKIISYRPIVSLVSINPYETISELYNDMHHISILNKLRGIIKSLVITDSDEKIVFTFDDLREEDLRIERWGNSVYYILEIHK